MPVPVGPGSTADPEEVRRISPLLLLGDGACGLAQDLLGRLLLKGERAIVLDGANAFDAYALARLARQAGRPAREVLSAVRVSRSFTWQQWLMLLEREARPAAARSGARWVAALGPLDLFADNEVRPFQAWPGARRAVAALKALAGAGLGVIAAQEERALRAGGRAGLLDFLKRECSCIMVAERRDERPARAAPAARQLGFAF